MKKILFAITASSILLFSCSKSLESLSCFNSSTTSGEVGETITFTNCSLDNFRSVWNFGDGKTSTLASPTNVYTKSGNYTVTLTTYSENGKIPNTTIQNIRILNPNQKFQDYLNGILTTTFNSKVKKTMVNNWMNTSQINPNILYLNNIIADAQTKNGENIIGTVTGSSITSPNLDSLRCNSITSISFMDGRARANLSNFTSNLDVATKKFTYSFTLKVYGAFDNLENGNYSYSFVTSE